MKTLALSLIPITIFKMQIDPDVVERCRHVPLHRLVGDSRVDRKVKIRCPFHSEDTPSCTLFPAGGYHCFGCGANGNSLDFVIRVGAKFNEAVEELSKYI